MSNYDQEDSVVDFNEASLYLPLAQTIFSICACAIVSVLSCWLTFSGTVSAVRTLALCSATGGLLMRVPLRIGKAHGVTVVFAALQLSIPLYLSTLVIEQLVHTCSMDASHAPSWRHVVFHGAVAVQVYAGFMRARAPLEDTDRPFILALLALMVIAIMPPPAVALVGPLCQSVDLWEATDRIVRAFFFGVLYGFNVYANTRTRNSSYSNTSIVFFRSASASIWVTGAMMWWMPLAVTQCAVILHARTRRNSSATRGTKQYKKLDTASSTDEDDLEADLGNLEPKLADPVAEQNRLLSEQPVYAEHVASTPTKLIDLGTSVATQEPAVAVGATLELVGQLPFQQVTLLPDQSSESEQGAFEASVARAMAAVEDGSSRER